MKDINKVLVKAHFKCNLKKNDVKNQYIFLQKCLYEAIGSLPVMPSLLPHVFEGEVKSSYFLQVC